MAWIRPTSHTANGWTSPENAYDGNTATQAEYAVGGNQWSPYLEMFLASAEVSQIRIYASRQNDQISGVQFDIYYNDAWVNIYDGEPATNGVSTTVDVDPSRDVTGVRVRFYRTGAGGTRWAAIHDTELYEVEAAGLQTIYPSGITSGEAFGSHAITTGAVNISPTGIASGEAFGSHTVAQPAEGQTLYPTGIVSAEAFGSHVLAVGAVTISPSGVASVEAFGSQTIVPGAVTISANGIESGEAFGNHAVTAGALSIQPTGITSGEVIGSHTLIVGVVYVRPPPIDSAEAFGSHTVATDAVVVSPTGIVSEETFGSHTVTTGAVVISPTGITSGETFGSHTLTTGAVILSPAGITSEEAFGDPVVGLSFQIVEPVSIESAETFGVPTVAGAYKVILVTLEITERLVELELLERFIELSVLERSISLEVVGLAQMGTTVRLKALFKDVDGALTDLDTGATLRIYDADRRLLTTEVCTRESIGSYYFDYTIPKPNSPATIYYEIGGTMGGHDVEKRGELGVKWV